jgi:hypothetical protein
MMRNKEIVEMVAFARKFGIDLSVEQMAQIQPRQTGKTTLKILQILKRINATGWDDKTSRSIVVLTFGSVLGKDFLRRMRDVVESNKEWEGRLERMTQKELWFSNGFMVTYKTQLELEMFIAPRGSLFDGFVLDIDDRLYVTSNIQIPTPE